MISHACFLLNFVLFCFVFFAFNDLHEQCQCFDTSFAHAKCLSSQIALVVGCSL